MNAPAISPEQKQKELERLWIEMNAIDSAVADARAKAWEAQAALDRLVKETTERRYLLSRVIDEITRDMTATAKLPL